MIGRVAAWWLAIAFAIVVAVPQVARPQEPLAVARELYAAAQYDEALGLLDAAANGKAPREQRQEIELYRALCLFAVGRQADADRAIETLIALDPLYRPADDVAPRIRSAISNTRKRLLPSIIQQQYSDAKTAFERQDYTGAAAGFKRVVDTINDPDIAQAAAQPPLSDLRMLAGGFHELSVKAIPPPPPPPPASPPPPSPQPVNLATRIFNGEGGEDVDLPIAIRQEMPQFPGRPQPGGLLGVLEIVISAAGRVETASMIEPTTPGYDRMVQAATANWLYQPATVNGTPVRFRKRIRISVPAP
jgi:tetratricopeptide (TPR) repeat protein